MVSSNLWIFQDWKNDEPKSIFLLQNSFKGNTNQKDNQSRPVSTDSTSEDQEEETEIQDNQNHSQNTMTEAAVSFVLGDPDPMEELETEDSFPETEANVKNQQLPVVPGLVERRKRLR